MTEERVAAILKVRDMEASLAWYGQLGFGLFHPVANAREARIIRFSGTSYTTP